MKRSLTSWSLEKMLLTGVKLGFVPKDDPALAKHLKKAEEKSARLVANPSKMVGMPVEDKIIAGMQTFIWNDQQTSDQKVLLYLHGGAYVSQPLSFHYQMLRQIVSLTNVKVVLPIYPKAPKYNYRDTYPKLVELYQLLLTAVDSPSLITIAGDSAGGGLVFGLAHLLVEKDLKQPRHLIGISPWLDIEMKNPEIKDYQALDPIVDFWYSLKVGQLWSAGKENGANPLVSPINSPYFAQMAPISLFSGSHEILYPDIRLLAEQLTQEKIPHQFIVKEKMNHVYPLFPIPEAKEARRQLAEIILE
ncbi:alpha/beta hydrolase [Streptococcus oricebi]|uniref:Alpha/beta hydrolase n=1 Tax=Streptococcus oricebi TaxID=1547447 RepID=A0ABS5B1L9_9STRE|nr:alpha/beta hydrolase [Streptococcus oricebi]MBP2622727.1 alpha/beta hydrolase [Streptococcus oricebi]